MRDLPQSGCAKATENGNRRMVDDSSVLQEKKRQAAAWAVHAFTASGIVLGFLALIAIIEGDVVAVFLWLGLALFIDGVDGSLARKVDVRNVTPQIDGTTLDTVIDYFNYVAVPAMMVYWFGFVPGGYEIFAAAAIMAVSCYTFANAGMKSTDYYFVGFPALWNLVVLYFHILQSDPWLNLGVIALCCVLTFVPLKYVHPFRVKELRGITIPITVLWAATSLRLVLINPETQRADQASPVIFWLWVGSSLYFLAVCVWRSIRPDPSSSPGTSSSPDTES
jgi:phosphatidylcholine synthase